MVYFAVMRCPMMTEVVVKIGFTKSIFVMDRLEQLQREHPKVFGCQCVYKRNYRGQKGLPYIIGLMPGGYDEEHELHARFADSLVFRKEWFRFGDSLAQFCWKTLPQLRKAGGEGWDQVERAYKLAETTSWHHQKDAAKKRIRKDYEAKLSRDSELREEMKRISADRPGTDDAFDAAEILKTLR